MGFGPTSSSILLGSGLTPQSVSTTVNLAKVATGVAAGVSHWRFKNVHPRLLLKLAIPGCLGALAGVTLLSSVPGATLKPILAGLLMVVGLRILFRFARQTQTSGASSAALEDKDGLPIINEKGTELAAMCGGVTNGLIGAWGPIVTPFLMHRNLPPRYAIGTVNTAEIAVAAVSATTLISTFGRAGFDARVVVAMLVGGVLAAPVAAWVIRYIPARPLGIATATLLLVTNVRELVAWAGLRSFDWAAYGLIAVLVAVMVLVPRTAGPAIVRNDAAE